MKLFGFTTEAHHGNTNKKREQTKKRQQRRPANLPARFAFRQQKNSETTQNGAGATPNKTHTNPWDCLQTRQGQAHRVAEICTNELRVCGPNKLETGCEAKQRHFLRLTIPLQPRIYQPQPLRTFIIGNRFSTS